MKKMFNDNIKLVFKVYNEKMVHRTNAEEMKEDLIQIGCMALWRACINYDPERGTTFSTYAYSSIYKSMCCALVRENRKRNQTISLSETITSKSEDCEITYEEVIASSVNVAFEVEIEDIVKRLSKKMGSNTERVIEMLRKGYTQKQIAKELNLSRSSVNKIVKKFREELKNTLFFED